jgi:hypothetical protein
VSDVLGAWSGRWMPQDRAGSVWQELPFEVTARCPGLRLRLEYDSGSGGVLDLGLVDAAGWRGWSGGSRPVVEIAPEGATPGYLDRGLPAGGWRVVLGLHRVPVGGLAWRVVVEQRPVRPEPAGPAPRPEPEPEVPPRRDLPAPHGLRWLAGDCHAHSVHSDGTLTLDELAVLARGRGLDYLWVSDHNTVSHHEHLAAVGARYGIDLLPAQEVTTADGHANAFGAVGWVDFRRPAASWAEQVAAGRGVLSVNHPIAGDCSWRVPGGGAFRATHAEVWHESWADRADGGPLAWWTAAGHPVPLGGSDFHSPGDGHPPGTPTTWVLCADGDVLGGMAAGRTAVSAAPDAPVLLRVDGPDLWAVDADGTNLVCPDGRRTPVRGDRVELRGHQGAHLLERDDRSLVAIAG